MKLKGIYTCTNLHPVYGDSYEIGQDYYFFDDGASHGVFVADVIDPKLPHTLRENGADCTNLFFSNTDLATYFTPRVIGVGDNVIVKYTNPLGKGYFPHEFAEGTVGEVVRSCTDVLKYMVEAENERWWCSEEELVRCGQNSFPDEDTYEDDEEEIVVGHWYLGDDDDADEYASDKHGNIVAYRYLPKTAFKFGDTVRIVDCNYQQGEVGRIVRDEADEDGDWMVVTASELGYYQPIQLELLN